MIRYEVWLDETHFIDGFEYPAHDGVNPPPLKKGRLRLAKLCHACVSEAPTRYQPIRPLHPYQWIGVREAAQHVADALRCKRYPNPLVIDFLNGARYRYSNALGTHVLLE